MHRLPGRARASERGTVMFLLLLALAGLAALGGLSILAVRGSMTAAGHDRFKTIALYAAESGAASAIDYLRRQSAAGVPWSALLEPLDDPPLSPADALGNGAPPGEVDNPFSADTQAWFEVVILNNPTDPGYATGDDTDGRVIIRATGHGPDGATAQVEWDVRSNSTGGTVDHCVGYAQMLLAEDGAARNDCLATIDATIVDRYTPGAN